MRKKYQPMPKKVAAYILATAMAVEAYALYTAYDSGCGTGER